MKEAIMQVLNRALLRKNIIETINDNLRSMHKLNIHGIGNLVGCPVLCSRFRVHFNNLTI